MTNWIINNDLQNQVIEVLKNYRQEITTQGHDWWYGLDEYDINVEPMGDDEDDDETPASSLEYKVTLYRITDQNHNFNDFKHFGTFTFHQLFNLESNNATQ